MKKVFLCTLVTVAGLCYNAKAQSEGMAPQNADAIKSYDGFRGVFEYPVSASERISINYSFSPKAPSSEARFTVSTANPIVVKASIKNEAGKEVLHWVPEHVSNAYIFNWDLSKLKVGNYTLDLYTADDPKSIRQIAFTKQ